MHPAWVLSLPKDMAVDAEDGDRVNFRSAHTHLSLRGLATGVRDALRRLTAPGDHAGRLARQVRETAGAPGLASWHYHLQQLAQRRLLRISVHQDAECLAVLEPIAPGFAIPHAGTVSAGRYVLSRFSWTYRRDDECRLESPRSRARIVLRDPRAAAFVHALCEPGTLARLVGRVQGLAADTAAALLGLLVGSDLACAVDEAGVTAEDADPALRCWEFHDLLFHSRSRDGRHDGVVGGSFPHAGRLEPPPALAVTGGDDPIELHCPDLGKLAAEDPPFARVLEHRRSVRRYAEEPISARLLGEFLYRVGRVRERLESEVDTPAGPVRLDYATRPYPAGGGLYELELYLAVNRCRGLAAGLYQYDPLGHRLFRRAGPAAKFGQLLADAARAAATERERLQILVILTARLPRIAWKYAGLAYALVLKDAGVVLQTMYLAATAMGLAPCALGGGDSDLFARAAGVDYYSETSVGEFLLGSAPLPGEKPARVGD